MVEMETAYKNKDFAAFAKLAMQVATLPFHYRYRLAMHVATRRHATPHH